MLVGAAVGVGVGIEVGVAIGVRVGGTSGVTARKFCPQAPRTNNPRVNNDNQITTCRTGKRYQAKD